MEEKDVMEVKKEVVIDENRCSGCGYCTIACLKGCLEIKGDKITSRGFTIPTFINPDECIACGNCVLMCPAYAIEVYETCNL